MTTLLVVYVVLFFSMLVWLGVMEFIQVKYPESKVLKETITYGLHLLQAIVWSLLGAMAMEMHSGSL
jgi:hypothetical protein